MLEFQHVHFIHCISETNIVKEETTDSVDVEGNPEDKTTVSASTSSGNSTESPKAETSTENAPEEHKTPPQKSETDQKVVNDTTNKDSTEVEAKLPNGAQTNTTPQTKVEDTTVPNTELKDEKNKTDNSVFKEDPVPNGQQQDDDDDSRLSAGETKCKLKDLQARGVYRGEHATFWPTGWRSKLCLCDTCKVNISNIDAISGCVLSI